MKLKLTTLHPEWPWARQTPGGRGRWDDAEFVIDRPGAGGDWWFVYNDLPREETVECGLGQSVLVTPEPPALKRYDPEFAAQFDWVITGDRDLDHPQKIYSHQGLPWHIGRLQQAGQNISFSKSYDELKSLWPIAKSRLLSVIASDKQHTPGHKLRFDFVERLRAHFGDRIDIFGWGGREIPDKWDGIAPHRFHIAIENSACPDYWTEKLSDAFLAGAFPIYWGCPNIHDYFAKESFAQIDIQNPGEALGAIESILQTQRNPTDALLEARNLVLDRYNLFNLLYEFANSRQAEGSQMQPKTLRPGSAFYKPPTFLQRVRRKLRKTALQYLSNDQLVGNLLRLE